MASTTDASLLGEIFRKHRKANKLSQAEAAAAARINENYLSAIECGYSFISVSKYLSLCEGIGLDPVQVMQEFVDSMPGRVAESRTPAEPSEKESRKGSTEPAWFVDPPTDVSETDD
ncbi:MAG: XRE family transcriptional regulator [Clostridia bacterium]|nr:XRE family transcriptional regulator [Clostridia bacterium]